MHVLLVALLFLTFKELEHRLLLRREVIIKL